MGDKIKTGLGDGKEFGLKINYLEKGEGTGGALNLLKKALKKSFIVVNLESKLDLDYKMVIDFHKNTTALATVATNDIKSFKGIYILEPEVTKYIPDGFSMLEEDIFPKLHKENKLNIYERWSEWCSSELSDVPVFENDMSGSYLTIGH